MVNRKSCYKLQKRFTLPVGHRLSKHNGRCANVHGHNLEIIVGLKTGGLDDNDMVMDFSEVKKIVGGYLDNLDHGLLINKNDPLYDSLVKCSERVIEFNDDPTAEELARYLYEKIENSLNEPFVKVDFVTVYENENSSITYLEED